MSGALGSLCRWLVRWALLAALWLALTDTQATPELVAGAVAAAIGATASGLVVRPGRPKTLAKSLALMRLGPHRLASPLVLLVADTRLVAAALWRRVVQRRPADGRFRAARYPAAGLRASAAGRALTEIWGSLPPNRYVVGVDEDDGVIVVHELMPSERPFDPLDSR
jgi:Na+/H+ ion antiporter subunit